MTEYYKDIPENINKELERLYDLYHKTSNDQDKLWATNKINQIHNMFFTVNVSSETYESRPLCAVDDLRESSFD